MATTLLDLTAVSDSDLFAAIAADDLRAGMARESNAAGWSLDESPAAALAAEYRRRYGADLPADRDASWAIYHTPRGWLWSCTAATAPDLRSASRGYQATASVTAAGRTRPAAEIAAERDLVAAIAARSAQDSGIREYRSTLVRHA